MGKLKATQQNKSRSNGGTAWWLVILLRTLPITWLHVHLIKSSPLIPNIIRRQPAAIPWASFFGQGVRFLGYGKSHWWIEWSFCQGNNLTQQTPCCCVNIFREIPLISPDNQGIDNKNADYVGRCGGFMWGWLTVSSWAPSPEFTRLTSLYTMESINTQIYWNWLKTLLTWLVEAL